MAEAKVLVCDECGATATQTVTIKYKNSNRLHDLCAKHLQSLLLKSRPMKRGRKPNNPVVTGPPRPKVEEG